MSELNLIVGHPVGVWGVAELIFVGVEKIHTFEFSELLRVKKVCRPSYDIAKFNNKLKTSLQRGGFVKFELLISRLLISYVLRQPWK